MELEKGRGTALLGEELLQVLHALEHGVAPGALGRRRFAAEERAQASQVVTQLAPEPIECFQGKGEAALFSRCLGGKASELLQNPVPNQSGAQAVAWQNIGEKDGESPAAAMALAAIGAKDTLSAQAPFGAIERIVPEEQAVAV